MTASGNVIRRPLFAPVIVINTVGKPMSKPGNDNRPRDARNRNGSMRCKVRASNHEPHRVAGIICIAR
jgi:hypothetical protein